MYGNIYLSVLGNYAASVENRRAARVATHYGFVDDSSLEDRLAKGRERFAAVAAAGEDRHAWRCSVQTG